MPLWIPLTIAAAFLQNVRSSLQKKLTGEMSALGATYVRFAYGVPVAVIYLGVLLALTGAAVPDMAPEFLVYAAVGGLAQIWGTVLLVGLFAYRNFAVGTTYSKTETIQTAVFGIVVLGDHLSVGAFAAILISLSGVVAISIAQSHLTLLTFWRSLGERPTLMGIGSGACYGVAAVCYRAASLSLDHPDFLVSASYTLVVVLLIQTATMTAWLGLRHPQDLAASFRAWRVSSLVGLAGALASVGWFTAMTIQNAAYVRALGQIELVFAFASSRFLFREKTSALEVAGIALVVGGILLLILYR
ncbi:MAG: DMT family transporter [Parvibaculum sp.]|uniref:DMT family transporter n=1 Tax=Parvibaculum sp. TaxID=2024848 RepID=UPI00326447CA